MAIKMHIRVHKAHKICIFIFNPNIQQIVFINILHIFFYLDMLKYIDM